jgi:hypothetical protein
MANYDVTLKDEITYYGLDAESEEEAKKKALVYWRFRSPSSTVKEKKKVKRTIHYTTRNYYTQNVWVDEDMDEDDIIELWEKDKIHTLNEPKIDDACINDKINVWVEI